MFWNWIYFTVHHFNNQLSTCNYLFLVWVDFLLVFCFFRGLFRQLCSNSSSYLHALADWHKVFRCSYAHSWYHTPYVVLKYFWGKKEPFFKKSNRSDSRAGKAVDSGRIGCFIRIKIRLSHEIQLKSCLRNPAAPSAVVRIMGSFYFT